MKTIRIVIFSLLSLCNYVFAGYDFDTMADYMKTARPISKGYLEELVEPDYKNIHGFKEAILGTNKNISHWDVFSTKKYNELVLMKKSRDPYTGIRSDQCINNGTLGYCYVRPLIGN